MRKLGEGTNLSGLLTGNTSQERYRMLNATIVVRHRAPQPSAWFDPVWLDPSIDPDIASAARRITQLKYQLEREAYILDPTGCGRCCERHCLECGFKSFGRRSTFEESPQCPVCGSADVRVDETSYPRHTDAQLRDEIESEYGNTGHRDLYRKAQDYLRRSHCRDRIRVLSRERGCRSRSHRAAAKPLAKSSSGDSGDDGPAEPPGPGNPHTATIGGVP